MMKSMFWWQQHSERSPNFNTQDGFRGKQTHYGHGTEFGTGMIRPRTLRPRTFHPRTTRPVHYFLTFLRLSVSFLDKSQLTELHQPWIGWAFSLTQPWIL
jgi:hypothetical protein